RVRPRSGGRAVRAGGQQNLPPPDLLRHPRRGEAHMSDAWHLAQINVGRMFGVKGDTVVQGFYDALDEVNALADASPGFVWRFTGEGNDATDVQPTVDPLLLRSEERRVGKE